MIRVLVVDDSPFFRRAITRMLEKDPEIKVIATASNGRDAIEKVLELSPDVVTLDIEMPIVDGFEALKEIMERKPTPVIMVSALTREGAKETIKALEMGAVDFIPKGVEKGILAFYDLEKDLIAKVKAVSRVKPGSSKVTKGATNFNVDIKIPLVEAIGIGSSTGGPVALKEVLKNFNRDNIEQAVFIAQHMPPVFTTILAERLNEVCGLYVKEAEDMEPVRAQTVYVAPGGKVMVVSKDKGVRVIRIMDPPSKVIYRPSVDLLFMSISEEYGGASMGLVLTGMGNDGTVGSKSIKERGGVVIVESEDTAIVYGMPRSVFEKGYADYKLPLGDIGPFVVKIVGRAKR